MKQIYCLREINNLIDNEDMLDEDDYFIDMGAGLSIPKRFNFASDVKVRRWLSTTVWPALAMRTDWIHRPPVAESAVPYSCVPLSSNSFTSRPAGSQYRSLSGGRM